MRRESIFLYLNIPLFFCFILRNHPQCQVWILSRIHGPMGGARELRVLSVWWPRYLAKGTDCITSLPLVCTQSKGPGLGTPVSGEASSVRSIILWSLGTRWSPLSDFSSCSCKVALPQSGVMMLFFFQNSIAMGDLPCFYLQQNSPRISLPTVSKGKWSRVCSL